MENFSKKIDELEKIKEENYKKEFDNIMYNVNSKNEKYNLGILMIRFIHFPLKKEDKINRINDETLKNLITFMVKNKSDERIS